MSMNIRVSTACQEMSEAYVKFGKNSSEFAIARNLYFLTIEEELRKEPANGWVELENPIDCLVESLYAEDSKEYIKEILNDYIRYCGIIKRVTGKDIKKDDVVFRALQ